MPTVKPSLVQPTLKSVDVETLMQDIPKYKEFIPEKDAEMWMSWLKDIKQDLLSIDEDATDQLDELMKAPKVEAQVNPIVLPACSNAMK